MMSLMMVRLEFRWMFDSPNNAERIHHDNFFKRILLVTFAQIEVKFCLLHITLAQNKLARLC